MAEEKKLKISLAWMREKREQKEESNKVKEGSNKIKEQNSVKQVSASKIEKIIPESETPKKLSISKKEKSKMELSQTELSKEEKKETWENILKNNSNSWIEEDNVSKKEAEKNNDWWVKKEIIEEKKDGNKNKEDDVWLIDENQEKTAKDKENNDIFANYTSDFEKKETSIMKKLIALKNIPKTRPVLVGGLIGSTVMWLSLFFYLTPDNHPIKNTQINLIGKEVIVENNNITKTWSSLPVEENVTQENLEWREEKIERGGVKFNINKKKWLDWVIIYQYNGEEFLEEKALFIKLDAELSKKKSEKVQNFFQSKLGK